MIYHRHAELVLGPMQRVRIGALACKKKGAKIGEIVIADSLSFRVFLLDGAKAVGAVNIAATL